MTSNNQHQKIYQMIDDVMAKAEQTKILKLQNITLNLRLAYINGDIDVIEKLIDELEKLVQDFTYHIQLYEPLNTYKETLIGNIIYGDALFSTRFNISKVLC